MSEQLESILNEVMGYNIIKYKGCLIVRLPDNKFGALEKVFDTLEEAKAIINKPINFKPDETTDTRT